MKNINHFLKKCFFGFPNVLVSFKTELRGKKIPRSADRIKKSLKIRKSNNNRSIVNDIIHLF